MFFTSEKKAVMPVAAAMLEAEAPSRVVSENIQFNRAAPEQVRPVRDALDISEESRGQRVVEEVMRTRGQFHTTHLSRVAKNSGAHLLNAEAGSITVGDGVRIEGSIVSFRTLEVLGFLKGELAGENLTIGGSGMLEGSVRVEALEVIGCFKGDAEVNGHLIVRATGKVAGTLSYRSIEIDNGGVVQGSLDICPIGDPDRIEDQGAQLYSGTAAENSTGVSPARDPLESSYMADGSREQGNG
jgi:cytoskeletal protein CcmA (bactofilin family)